MSNVVQSPPTAHRSTFKRPQCKPILLDKLVAPQLSEKPPACVAYITPLKSYLDHVNNWLLSTDPWEKRNQKTDYANLLHL
jgi:hypothetical protein